MLEYTINLYYFRMKIDVTFFVCDYLTRVNLSDTLSLKIHASIDYLYKNKIRIYYVEDKNELGIILYKERIGVGRFTTKNPRIPCLHIQDLSIFIEDKHTKKGLARLMICAFVIETLIHKKMHIDRKLFIDTDASDGFWDAIGMKPNKNEHNIHSSASGYEKVFKFSNLSEWAFGYVVEKINY